MTKFSKSTPHSKKTTPGFKSKKNLLPITEIKTQNKEKKQELLSMQFNIDDWKENNKEHIETVLNDICDKQDNECRKYYIKEWTNEAKKKYIKLLKRFQSLPQIFPIYRIIRIDNFDDFFKNIKNGRFLPGYDSIGIYWSWEKESAHPWWKLEGEKILLTGLINKKNVNWNETMFQNLDLSVSEEKEIRLKKSVPVILKKIERSNKKQEINVNIEILT